MNYIDEKIDDVGSPKCGSGKLFTSKVISSLKVAVATLVAVNGVNSS